MSPTMAKSREEWIEEAKATLDDWDQRMALIEGKVLAMRLNAEHEIRTKLDAAKRALGQAHQRWTRVRGEAADVLDVVSAEVGAAWDLNREALERSLSEIRSALGRVGAER